MVGVVRNKPRSLTGSGTAYPILLYKLAELENRGRCGGPLSFLLEAQFKPYATSLQNLRTTTLVRVWILHSRRAIQISFFRSLERRNGHGARRLLSSPSPVRLNRLYRRQLP